MAELSKRRWNGWAIALGLAAIAAGGALHLQPALLTDVAWLFDTNYGARAMAKLEAKDAAGALAELEAGTLLDGRALELLSRMPVSTLDAELKRDAALRRQIAFELQNLLGTRPRLDPSDRALLKGALRNGRALVALEPEAASSHLFLGLMQLRKGIDTSAPDDFRRASRSLATALKLDPEIPNAKQALALAQARSR